MERGGKGSEPKQSGREQSPWAVEAGFRRMYFANTVIWLLYSFCLWLGEFQINSDRTYTRVCMDTGCTIFSSNLHSPGVGTKKSKS